MTHIHTRNHTHLHKKTIEKSQLQADSVNHTNMTF